MTFNTNFMFKLQVILQKPFSNIFRLVQASLRTRAQYFSLQSASHRRRRVTSSVTTPGRQNHYDKRSRLKMSQKSLELISIADNASKTDTGTGRLLKWANVGAVASAIGYWALRNHR